MNYGSFIRNPLAPLSLVALMIAGSWGFHRYWPSDLAGKAQAYGALLTFIAAVILAIITWAYVRTTYEALEVQQRQLAAMRPRIESELMDGSWRLDGRTHDNKLELVVLARSTLLIEA